MGKVKVFIPICPPIDLQRADQNLLKGKYCPPLSGLTILATSKTESPQTLLLGPELFLQKNPDQKSSPKKDGPIGLCACFYKKCLY